MSLHHVTIWVPDLDRAANAWGWLLERIGYEPTRSWEHGRLWQSGNTRIVLEASPDMVPGMLFSRMRPGLNHMAFELADEAEIVAVAGEATSHGWTAIRNGPDEQMHPLASGSTAAYLEDADGFEVELVATDHT